MRPRCYAWETAYNLIRVIQVQRLCCRASSQVPTIFIISLSTGRIRLGKTLKFGIFRNSRNSSVRFLKYEITNPNHISAFAQIPSQESNPVRPDWFQWANQYTNASDENGALFRLCMHLWELIYKLCTKADFDEARRTNKIMIASALKL